MSALICEVGENAPPARPLAENSNGLVTLWELVIRFQAASFTRTMEYLYGLESSLLKGSAASGAHQALLEKIDGALSCFQQLSLTVSCAQIRRIKMSAKTHSDAKLGEMVGQLIERIRDELEDVMFVSLDKAASERYRSGRHAFGVTAEKFPSAVDDIEAARCLALELGTATVFHLMRIMELGIWALSANLGVETGRNRSWDALLEKCDAELSKRYDKRSETWNSNGLFYSEAVAYLRAVKGAWRNPTMHIERQYDSEKASEIWNSIKAFMAHLSTRIGETVEN